MKQKTTDQTTLDQKLAFQKLADQDAVTLSAMKRLAMKRTMMKQLEPSAPMIGSLFLLVGVSALSACSSSPRQASDTQIATESAVVEVEAAPVDVLLDMKATRSNAGAATMSRIAIHPSVPPYPAPDPKQNTQNYENHIENPIKRVSEQPVSTFSIDVDTGSYTNARQMIWQGQKMPSEAIRAEEFINYFEYDYPQTQRKLPFTTNTLLTTAPWDSSHQLLRVALKAQDIQAKDLPATNLVYLIDVSGSMGSEDKLDLVKTALLEMTDHLRAQDKISIVTYSGKEELVLSGISGAQKSKIKSAINGLSAEGSTNGEDAINMAYRQAQTHLIKNGINRILLLTDGDFNVGTTDTKSLTQMIRQYQSKGIGFSTLGVGNQYYNDGLMEQLADAGHGKYSYLDSIGEARKVLIHEMSSTLANVAQDVKVQVEFNPAYVQEYRLIGYDNRQLAREDFNNDKVDAGDIGAGHTVTALYEIIPVGAKSTLDPLRYQNNSSSAVKGTRNGEIAYLKLRYKPMQQTTSQLIEAPIREKSLVAWKSAGADMYFATAAAQFATKLQQRKDIPVQSWQQIIQMAQAGATDDRFGQKQEMIALMKKAQLQYPD